MPKRRDIVVGVVIAVAGAFVFALVILTFVGLFSQEGEFSIAGVGASVGVVEVYGALDEDSGRPIIKQLDKWADTRSIKAIVLHVNSPGGGAAISQEIYDAVKRARENKPVVAAMASVSASGGYYISCAADRIIANPGTLTGSIGVIMQFHTFQGLMDKVGMSTETVKSGDLKDVGSYSRAMTEKENLMLQSVVNDTYEQFVDAVAQGRGMDRDQVYPLADGSIFTGLQAYNLGLVDTLGGLKEAIDLAASLAGIKGKPNVVRTRERKQLTIFDLLGAALGRLGAAVKTDATGPELMFLYQ